MGVGEIGAVDRPLGANTVQLKNIFEITLNNNAKSSPEVRLPTPLISSFIAN